MLHLPEQGLSQIPTLKQLECAARPRQFHGDKAHKKGNFSTVQYFLTGIEWNVWGLACSRLTQQEMETIYT